MEGSKSFIRAYHEFRESVELGESGILPDLDDVVWCMLMGVPKVPADDDASIDAQLNAIDQRVIILKAVFVEVNRSHHDEFIDQGLKRYREAGELAKKLLLDADSPLESV
jgi:hypothetical protein